MIEILIKPIFPLDLSTSVMIDVFYGNHQKPFVYFIKLDNYIQQSN